MAKEIKLDTHILKSKNNLEEKLKQHMLEIKEELERANYDEITIVTTIKQMSKTQLSLEIAIRETYE